MAEFNVSDNSTPAQAQSQAGPSYPSPSADPAPAASPTDEAPFALVPEAATDPENEEAAKVAAEDAKTRNENPNAPVAREANPAVGGESF